MLCRDVIMYYPSSCECCDDDFFLLGKANAGGGAGWTMRFENLGWEGGVLITSGQLVGSVGWMAE